MTANAEGGTRVRVLLPAHLRALAQAPDEVVMRVPEGPTTGDVLEALEAAYPVLVGLIRDRATGRRRPLVRFYACEQDLSNLPVDTPLPPAVAQGSEPFMVVGAIAGG